MQDNMVIHHTDEEEFARFCRTGADSSVQEVGI